MPTDAEKAAWNAAQPTHHTKNSMMRELLDKQMVPKKMVTAQPIVQAPRKFGDYDPHKNIMDNLYSKRSMTIQVTPIENGYVVAIADAPNMMPRLFYATDLADVGQQITAFGVTQELEGKGANT